MPRIVEFRNVQDEREEKRYGKRCLIKTDRTKIIKVGFFSEKYYYGDYTKMNMLPCKSLSDSDNT